MSRGLSFQGAYLQRLCAGVLAWLELGCGPLDAGGSSCGPGGLELAELQGAGPVSPHQGEWLRVSGVVTLERAQLGARSGFFLQSGGARPAGLFVVQAGSAGPGAGERVRVRGRVAELAGVTALDPVESIEPCGSAPLQPLDIELASEVDAERWEGVWLRARQTWTLVDTSQLESRGELGVSPRGRLYAPGHPLGSESVRWSLLGADAASAQWVRTGAASEHLRLGAQLSGLSAVVLGGASPALLAVSAPEPRAVEPRALAPAAPGALRVAALNLDNYFAPPGARGARSELELARQRDKLVAALRQLDADILALSELGAAGASAGASSSLRDLLSALNARLPPELAYEVNEGAPPAGALASPDALRCAIAYRPGRVGALGPAWFATSAAFRRAPVFQSFGPDPLGLTLGVVHLKSKLCNGAEQLVGREGCGAQARAAEARALVELLPQLPEPLLLIGDFNSDSREAPLEQLKRAGLSDLFEALPAAERYTYVFEGRAAQLDHALASPALAGALTRAQIWHINADEPALLGYGLEHPPGAYRPDARRSSDHDPIVVDFAPPLAGQ